MNRRSAGFLVQSYAVVVCISLASIWIQGLGRQYSHIVSGLLLRYTQSTLSWRTQAFWEEEWCHNANRIPIGVYMYPSINLSLAVLPGLTGCVQVAVEVSDLKMFKMFECRRHGKNRISDPELKNQECLRFQQIRRQKHEAVNHNLELAQTFPGQNLGHSRLVEELVVSVKLVVVLAERRKPGIRKTGTLDWGNTQENHHHLPNHIWIYLCTARNATPSLNKMTLVSTCLRFWLSGWKEGSTWIHFVIHTISTYSYVIGASHRSTASHSECLKLRMLKSSMMSQCWTHLRCYLSNK